MRVLISANGLAVLVLGIMPQWLMALCYISINPCDWGARACCRNSPISSQPICLRPIAPRSPQSICPRSGALRLPQTVRLPRCARSAIRARRGR